jgi:hypothetical protein
MEIGEKGLRSSIPAAAKRASIVDAHCAGGHIKKAAEDDLVARAQVSQLSIWGQAKKAASEIRSRRCWKLGGCGVEWGGGGRPLACYTAAPRWLVLASIDPLSLSHTHSSVEPKTQ